MDCWSRGASNKLTARRPGFSVHTAKFHGRSMTDKFDFACWAAGAAFAHSGHSVAVARRDAASPQRPLALSAAFSVNVFGARTKRSCEGVGRVIGVTVHLRGRPIAAAARPRWHPVVQSLRNGRLCWIAERDCRYVRVWELSPTVANVKRSSSGLISSAAQATKPSCGLRGTSYPC